MAQVIYEPVRYQFQTPRGEKYYYGGVDPRVHMVAGSELCRGFMATRRTCTTSTAGTRSTSRRRCTTARRSSPTASPFRDASYFGYTPADVAQRGVRELADVFPQGRPARERDSDRDRRLGRPGERADATSSRTRHHHSYPAIRTTTLAGRRRPGQVIIIPKRLMDKKVKDVGGEKPLKVASAK